MITTTEVRIKTTENLSSEYIESNLKELGFKVLRWAIVDVKDGFYVLDIAIVS